LFALQTGVPGEGVNSSCNLGKAASAPLPPRVRHRHPDQFALALVESLYQFAHAAHLARLNAIGKLQATRRRI
jgi:hypothetical protein